MWKLDGLEDRGLLIDRVHVEDGSGEPPGAFDEGTVLGPGQDGVAHCDRLRGFEHQAGDGALVRALAIQPHPGERHAQRRVRDAASIGVLKARGGSHSLHTPPSEPPGSHTLVVLALSDQKEENLITNVTVKPLSTFDSSHFKPSPVGPLCIFHSTP